MIQGGKFELIAAEGAQMKQLSIIVPVFNAEQYLPECLSSILSQTYNDYELLLVDDGSTDRSGAICEQFCKSHNNIKVIHQNNTGALGARARGVREATGTYVTFPDADDWVDPALYEYMMNDVKEYKADILAAGYTVEREDGTSIPCENAMSTGVYDLNLDKELVGKALYSGEFYKPGIVASLSNKIVKKDLFTESLLSIDKRITNGDDAAWIYPLVSNATTLCVDNTIKSNHYRIIQGSLGHCYDDLYFYRIVLLVQSMKENLMENEYALESLQYYSLYMTRDAIYRYFDHNKEKSFKKMMEEIDCFLSSIQEVLKTENIEMNHIDHKEKRMIRDCIECNSKGIVGAYFLGGYKSRIKRILRNNVSG